MKALRKFWKNDEAIAVTEYGLLVALIAVALIAVVLLFGTNISAWFTTKTSQITTV
jgi:Flp pilus assembly pilin Flp